MPDYVPIEQFLELAVRTPIVDVRSPIEFQRAHITKAVNIPLFLDEQRAEVGTCYQESGRQEALLLGLDFVGPRMRSLAELLNRCAVDNRLLLHCWRGGMRSRSVAWLAEQIDLQVSVLQGGYKAFRRRVLESFKRPLKLFVLSGLTGAGKTVQIDRLKDAGEQVIDLEKIASHRGSAFGGVGLASQPTTEHFENQLFAEIQALDTEKRIWVEDESRNIGAIKLPHHFFNRLRISPAIFMDVDKSLRNQLIIEQYGRCCQSQLTAAVNRIRKRLGGQNANRAERLIESGQTPAAVDLLLDYYDRLYLANKDRLKRKCFVDFATEHPTSAETTQQLIELADQVEQQALAG